MVSNESTSARGVERDSAEESKIKLASMADMVLRWRRFIAWSVTIGIVLSTIVAFLLPPKYRSSASIFPAEKTDLLGAFAGVSSLVKSFAPARGLAALTGADELDRYVAILKSSRVLGAVIREFDLVNVYEITSYPMEKTTKELLNNVEFSIESEGNLVISVFDEDAQRAADVANFFVDELNRTNSELQAQNARGNRQFIEDRYQKNLAELAAAEDSLRAFQKRYGVVSMPEQTEASIKVVAELSAQLAALEVQLGVVRKTQSVDHPAVLAVETEVQELRKKIYEMNEGTTSHRSSMKVFVPFREIPDLGTEFIRRYRDVEIQYKILQFIAPIYEQAKVEERRETPSVVILDRAGPAERKAKPKRSLIMLGGAFVALIGSLIVATAGERWTRERELNTQLYTSLSRLTDAVKTDLSRLRRRK